MRGYIGINEVSTACVRFVREHEVFEDDLADLKNIRAKGMLLYVVAGEECCGSGDAVFQAIGSKLFESNHPYGPNARLE